MNAIWEATTRLLLLFLPNERRGEREKKEDISHFPLPVAHTVCIFRTNCCLFHSIFSRNWGRVCVPFVVPRLGGENCN